MAADKKKNSKKIAIMSCCIDDWGGSEELWARCIPYLRNMDTQITLYKANINKQHPSIKKIIDMGVYINELKPSLLFHKRISRRLNYLYNRMINRYYHIETHHYFVKNFHKDLLKTKPNLVLISQGINFDGLHYAHECFKLNLPYVIVSQKAVEFYWPNHNDRPFMRKTLQNALICCFVSFHNLRLTEEQFGVKIKNSRVVFNPIKVERQPLKYPSTDSGFHLACIGRLFLIDKGQDTLIRILSQRKWRDRPLTVSFIGDGIDRISIKEMVDFYKLKNIYFIDYQSDVRSLWLNYHALILPSRSEGLPLTMMEAMAAGRPVIVSNAGGNAEFIEDGLTGFVGEANRYSFDDAMERAWRNRNHWETIGRNASYFIKKNVPECPEKDFADLLKIYL